jgi:4-alpha-glucanotransferase
MGNRASGVLLHVSALPSRYGIGGMGRSAYDLVDLIARTKQTYWQILPLNPTDPANGNSPYFSSSAFAGNPFLIDPEKVYNDGLVGEEDLENAEIPAKGYVDYDAVAVHKFALLDKAFLNFKKKGDFEAFQLFCDQNSSWLDDYALYTAIKEENHGKPWFAWKLKIKDREETALRELSKKLAVSVKKEKFMQYLFFKQWHELKSYANDKGIKIIGDLPIYVSYDSVDVWTHPYIFKLDESKLPTHVSGVPPDYFSATGQLWNNPVYKWDVLKENGYKWWIERFRETFRKFDLVRIDHFRGLVQFWEVPAGAENAIAGEWRDVPTYDFFDAVIKELKSFPVIAEDLGTITEDVKNAMSHYGFPGMKILMFAFGNDDPRKHPYLPHNYDKNCLVYTGTHDNNTVLGWIAKEATQEEVGRLQSYIGRYGFVENINWEMIRLAMMSVADTAIIQLQDIIGLGAGARMNQPSSAFGNWKWQLIWDQLEPWHIETLERMTKIYGRDRRDAPDPREADNGR